MKSHKILNGVTSLRMTHLFRSFATIKHKRKIVLRRFYGTSSKPAENDLASSKLNFLNYLKTYSDNILPAVWKTVTVATSLLNNVSFKVKLSRDFKSNASGDDVNKQADEHIPSTSTQTKPVPLTKSEDDLETDFIALLRSQEVQSKSKDFLKDNEKSSAKHTQISISKSSLEQRSRFLVHSLLKATSSGSQLLRLEEVCKHLLLYPNQKSVMCKAGLLRIVLGLQKQTSDYVLQAQTRMALSLIGFHCPPKGHGIRILSIDGGGTRGMVSIEILRQLEAKTNKRIYELFDFICGVSSGAILCTLLGALRLSLDDCEMLYRKLSDEVFNQSTIWGTGRLMWNHAYYDTTTWMNVLTKTFDEKLLIDSARQSCTPKLAAISAVMNLPRLQAFVFRNYDLAPRMQSYYLGSCRHKMWEAVRASGAAPGYFEEFSLDEYLHQDGGIMVNNPTAVAIHEAQLLWPTEPIQCVVSLGNGRFIPPVQPNYTYTSLKTKVLKMIDSATDTEAVHISLHDLLSPNTYFRINPYLTEFHSLDENRPEKLDQMKVDAQMYLRRNEYKFINAIAALSIQRGYIKQVSDWWNHKKCSYF